MIRKVKIANYKSVQELELELGRVNVFIGENGCGKTSILEAIAMGSAAAEKKLDNEFLNSRGIRVVEPNLMKSAFNNSGANEFIYVEIKADKEDEHSVFRINNTEGIGSQWVDIDLSKDILFNYLELLKRVERIDKSSLNERKNPKLDTLYKSIKDIIREESLYEDFEDVFRVSDLSFLIFAPENYFLRRFEEEGQIRPLGIRGEGLFRHLTELAKEEPETIAAISQQLNLIDWFEKIEIPNDLQFSERRINITDRFIKDTITHFDQRSANEGFLYLLFYFTLFISKYTPNFFAIDNIDNALNPKLCAKLTTILAKLSAEHNKQVILTTHNPAILDGLDLTDDEQRLFVIYRNADGETTARRVPPPKQVEAVEPVRLSEAFIRGYLGGLPKNF